MQVTLVQLKHWLLFQGVEVQISSTDVVAQNNFSRKLMPSSGL